ncbi:hypothetical protein P5E82_14975, partial [Clostridium perfringens]|nr:hypothetical protein [Clostridium perfringens]
TVYFPWPITLISVGVEQKISWAQQCHGFASRTLVELVTVFVCYQNAFRVIFCANSRSFTGVTVATSSVATVVTAIITSVIVATTTVVVFRIRDYPVSTVNFFWPVTLFSVRVVQQVAGTIQSNRFTVVAFVEFVTIFMSD